MCVVVGVEIVAVKCVDYKSQIGGMLTKPL
jgi:hypothetical protein